MSTFHGLEMAKQALFAQQSGLYTTGHNISNANTKGYSRQRVNFETASPYPSASRNRPEMPGQLGTGVKTGSIERVRDKYIDAQYRSENTKSGYWNTRAGSLERMENIMSEMSDKGLSGALLGFEKSLSDLATDPKSSKSVVVQKGVALADSFNHISKSLEKIRGDLNKEINNTVKTANSLLKQINDINEQIKEIEPHGYLPNDLYDKRDNLIDELSGIIDIDVDYKKSAESSLDIADGIATITLSGNKDVSLVTEDGFNKLNVEYEEGKAVDDNNKINDVKSKTDDNNYNVVTKITVGDDKISLNEKTGSLSALIHSYGLGTSKNPKGEFPEMLNELDKMAAEFVKEFNDIYMKDESGNENGNGPFFNVDATAGTIVVNEDLVKNPNEVNMNFKNGQNDGGIAKKLVKLFGDDQEIVGDASIHGFYDSLIGDMGVEIQESNKMAENTAILHNQVNNQRQSISAVSLDEEMSNMIKFQHAYNAAARSMTAMDEILDKVINGMGLVGR